MFTIAMSTIAMSTIAMFTIAMSTITMSTIAMFTIAMSTIAMFPHVIRIERHTPKNSTMMYCLFIVTYTHTHQHAQTHSGSYASSSPMPQSRNDRSDLNPPEMGGDTRDLANPPSQDCRHGDNYFKTIC